MNKIILALAIICSGGLAHAIQLVYVSTPTFGEIPISEEIWIVAKGSETYRLDEFVKSGRFCKWRGWHEWAGFPGQFLEPQKCKRCSVFRGKIKINQREEIWEP